MDFTDEWWALTYGLSTKSSRKPQRNIVERIVITPPSNIWVNFHVAWIYYETKVFQVLFYFIFLLFIFCNFMCIRCISSYINNGFCCKISYQKDTWTDEWYREWLWVWGLIWLDPYHFTLTATQPLILSPSGNLERHRIDQESLCYRRLKIFSKPQPFSWRKIRKCKNYKIMTWENNEMGNNYWVLYPFVLYFNYKSVIVYFEARPLILSYECSSTL